MEFAEVKSRLDDKSIVLIDVRNPDEVESMGKIPGSNQVPWPQLEEAISLSDADFVARYGFAKPQKDAEIVTHCIGGGRAGKAQVCSSLGPSVETRAPSC